MHVTRKYSQSDHQFVKEASNPKTIIPSYLPGHGVFKNLCFVSIGQRVNVSCAFAYNAVDINKIVAVYLANPPPLICTAITIAT